ncbi:hypothetical protein C8N32_110122 [Rhodovulum imhoffii]|uniref:SUKH-4 immunity protein of toxin-antitoxin system n=1 Tax=Rhodovulum imhoffii TaxID=365340 RepID=A0A2T5BRF5_9RHOB|nr:hypothetical protein [Rhodovulum imhoffii]PTN01840.1 hypothetical protein C8N32_110122 [Rhodovulum imhoffii]
MIMNLDDALLFYAEREEKFASFGATILKRRSRQLDGLNAVVEKLGLPASFARCADELCMERVSLGYFDLCPGDPESLCSSLLALNGDTRNPSLPDNLLSVAGFDADIIAVAKGEPHHVNGTVFYVDVTSSPIPQVTAISDSFSDFLVLASALDQVILEGRDDPEAAINQLALNLGYAGYADKWQLIASMAV